MNIAIIKLITPYFSSLKEELASINYQVSLEAFSFILKNKGQEFTIQDLQDVVNFTPPPAGYLNDCTFADAKKNINKYLSYTLLSGHNQSNAEGFQEVCPEIANERQKKFWEIVGSVFPLPPAYCLEHYPDPDSYFAPIGTWHFTYCFFKGKKGLIIHGSAFD